MEFLVDLIMALAFEGTLELSTSRKIPNWIRYPLIVLIGLFFAAFIGLIFAFFAVRKFRKVYILKKGKWN